MNSKQRKEAKQQVEALEDAALAITKSVGWIRMAYPMHPEEALDSVAEELISQLLQIRKRIFQRLDEKYLERNK